MIKAFLLSLLIAASAFAEDNPKLAIGSSEQAIAHFQWLRDTELKTVLSDAQLGTVISFRNASFLSVQLIEHWEYEAARSTDQAPRYADPLGPHAPSDDAMRFVGRFSAASDSKDPSWRLSYSTRKGSIMEVFLDATTGKILYLCVIPGI